MEDKEKISPDCGNDISCLKNQFNIFKQKLEKYRTKTHKYENLYTKTKYKIQEKCDHKCENQQWGWHDTYYTCGLCEENITLTDTDREFFMKMYKN